VTDSTISAAEKSQDPRIGPAVFRAKCPEVPAFETRNMLYFDLEMYSSAPIKHMGRRGRSAVDVRVNLGDWNMLGMVARWGHNTLLIGLALMTCVIFYALFK
jgi:hypothetical protein